MFNAALTHAEILRPRDATELNNDGRSKLPKRTEFINFPEKDFTIDDSSFCLLFLLTIDVKCLRFCLISFFVCKRHFCV